MASAYRPWAPSTGPGYINGNIPQYLQFQALGLGVTTGLGYTSNLGPNSTPPQVPVPDENGILLENSVVDFVALEASLGGPAAHLIME